MRAASVCGYSDCTGETVSELLITAWTVDRDTERSDGQNAHSGSSIKYVL